MSVNTRPCPCLLKQYWYWQVETCFPTLADSEYGLESESKLGSILIANGKKPLL